MSKNLKTLLTTAAELRAVGNSWNVIAKKVGRKTKTCQEWPRKHRNLWEPIYRGVQERRFEQTSNECHFQFLSLVRHDDWKVKQKAFELWLKFGAKAYGTNGNMVLPVTPAGQPRPAAVHPVAAALAAAPSPTSTASDAFADRFLTEGVEELNVEFDELNRLRAKKGQPPMSPGEYQFREAAAQMEKDFAEANRQRVAQGLPPLDEEALVAEWVKHQDELDKMNKEAWFQRIAPPAAPASPAANTTVLAIAIVVAAGLLSQQRVQAPFATVGGVTERQFATVPVPWGELLYTGNGPEVRGERQRPRRQRFGPVADRGRLRDSTASRSTIENRELPAPPPSPGPRDMPHELPALAGGPPVRPQGPPAWPQPDAAVDNAIRTALRDGTWGVYHGPHVPRLEQMLSELHGVAHALTCASGTLAVETALRALGVGPGDEVILSAYDFEPTFVAIHALGAQPVLVDTLPGDAGMNVSAVEPAITPATKAIVATHLHGGLVDMARLAEISAARNVRVLEDAAQAPGAKVQGRGAGAWGDIGILSFGGSKLLTAGRGGALLTNHAELFQRARLALRRGVQLLAPLSEIQAAAIIPQLAALAPNTKARARAVQELRTRLADVPGLRLFDGPRAADESAYYKVGFFLTEADFGLARATFVKALRAEGIAFDEGFRALHVGRAPGRYRAACSLAQAELAGESVVKLHHPHLALGSAGVAEVAAAVQKTYRNAHLLQ